jgi:formylglycine-generating enzyme required for sulfatase activity
MVYVMDDQNEWSWRKEFNWKNPGFTQTDRDPVVCVSWNDTKSFLDWLRSEYGVAATLPTEAQFEYANRGGKSSLFFTGDTIDGLAGYANVGDLNIRKRRGDTHPLSWAPFDDGYMFTSPAAHYQPNPFGLYDITGNAREWCRDWYDTESYSTLPASDPEQVIKPELVKMMERVTRGASWYSRPMECRLAFREKFPPDSGTSKLGFRVLVPVD